MAEGAAVVKGHNTRAKRNSANDKVSMKADLRCAAVVSIIMHDLGPTLMPGSRAAVGYRHSAKLENRRRGSCG